MSNIVQLRNRLGTIYVINAFKDYLRKFLDECLENGFTLDLIDCRLGPDCAGVLSVYYGKVNIIDSGNAERDTILKNNAVEAVKVFEPYPNYVFPKECTFDTLLEEFNKFKPGDKFNLQPDVVNERQLAFATMLILMLPEVEFDIYHCSNPLYGFIRNEWLLNSNHHDTYWEFTIDGIFVRGVDANGFMGTGKYGTGRLPEDSYVRSQNCLPYDFSNKYLLEFDDQGNPIGEWALVVKKCVKILTAPKRKRGPILADFVKLREI